MMVRLSPKLQDQAHELICMVVGANGIVGFGLHDKLRQWLIDAADEEQERTVRTTRAS
jgi:hypothetical protein